MNINFVVEGVFGVCDGSLVCIDGWLVDLGNLILRVFELRYYGCFWLMLLVIFYFWKGNEWLEENEVICFFYVYYFVVVDVYFI